MLFSAEPANPKAIREALAPERLEQRARNLTQLDDFGSQLRPALEIFQQLFSELALTQHALAKLTTHATQSLVTRLRLRHALKHRPSLFAARLNAPLIIVGLPRTGTSFLLQLLASLPNRRFLRFWEAREPIADETDDDDRAARYQHLAALESQAAPEMAFKHSVDPDGPEECMFLLDPSMVSLSFAFLDAPCRAYSEWVHSPSHTEPYQMYRQLLLHLQASAPEQQLVLKAPAHFGQLAALRRAVPEARLVHTHRDPLLTLASACSLGETVLGPAVAGFGRQQLGQEMLACFEGGIARNTEQRHELPESYNFDLQFQDLTRDPLGSVERLHRHFGFEWTAEAAAGLQAAVARARPAQAPKHQYQLQDYGLEADEVAERLAPYRHRWGFV